MQRRRLTVVLLLSVTGFVALGSCSERHELAGAAPRAPVALDFVERTTGHASLGDRLPLLVVMHGLGDSPEDFLHVFDQVTTPARLIAVRAPDAWGSGTSWYPIDADDSVKARQILARASAVAELIGQLAKQRPTRGKAVVSGFSQGGVLSFALASYHADRLQAALPIAGYLPVGTPAPNRPAPSWFSVLAFHGDKDARIPFVDGERTFERLKGAGYKGTLSRFPGVGHGIPDAMLVQLTAAVNESLDQAARSEH